MAEIKTWWPDTIGDCDSCPAKKVQLRLGTCFKCWYEQERAIEDP